MAKSVNPLLKMVGHQSVTLLDAVAAANVIQSLNIDKDIDIVSLLSETPTVKQLEEWSDAAAIKVISALATLARFHGIKTVIPDAAATEIRDNVK